ncbi:MAG TPA: PilW family protein [Oleiagrimonas sp.]|nr:PilW family protein [Oleiagrimonas sp.]
MNRSNSRSCRFFEHARRQDRGFTLIELMVAMLLGLIVIAGVSSVFLANVRSYHTNEALSDVQSNSRIAFELMARDIRQAGLTGCVSNNGRVANVLDVGPNNGGTAWWANWGNAVRGYEQGGVADPAVSVGTGVAERAADTDSLQVMGATGAGVSVNEGNGTSSTKANFKLNEPTSNLETGDIIIVCDPDHAAIVQITDYNDSNVTLVHNPGGAVSPGNCSKGLGFPTVCTTNGNGYNFGPNSRITKMAAHDWYIGNNPVGGRSLYRQAAVLSGTTVSPVAQEMVRNVTDMQIEYLQPGTTGNEFVTADKVTDWSKVDAVRVTLTLHSTDQRTGSNAKPLERIFSSTTTIRNRVG